MWWKYFPGTPIVLGCVEHGVSPQGMIDSCGEKKTVYFANAHFYNPNYYIVF